MGRTPEGSKASLRPSGGVYGPTGRQPTHELFHLAAKGVGGSEDRPQKTGALSLFLLFFLLSRRINEQVDQGQRLRFWVMLSATCF